MLKPPVSAPSSSQPPVRIVLVGCGYHMQNTLGPAVRAVAALEVVAACDLVAERAEAVARYFPGAAIYDNAAALLGDGRVEACVMAGPPQMHEELGRAMLQNDLHVFLEKPAAVSAESLSELAKLADERDVIAVAGHNLRHSDAWKVARDLSREERFGDAVAFHASYLARAPRGPRWGLDAQTSFLLTHAVHPVDLAVALFGRVSATFAHATAIAEDGLVLTAHLEFEAGCAATVFAGTAAPSMQLDLRLVSDRSEFIRVDGLRQVTTSVVDRLERGAFRQTASWGLRTMESSAAAAGYQPELDAFARAIRGERPVTASLRDVLPTYEALASISNTLYRSAV
jgi:phthalate 4,5-cis-dihydrodiol dehydrogenase